jgi:hypothetical protein
LVKEAVVLAAQLLLETLTVRRVLLEQMVVLEVKTLVLLVVLMVVVDHLAGMDLVVMVEQVLMALFALSGLATSAHSQAQQQEICKEISWRLLQQQITHQKII